MSNRILKDMALATMAPVPVLDMVVSNSPALVGANATSKEPAGVTAPATSPAMAGAMDGVPAIAALQDTDTDGVPLLAWAVEHDTASIIVIVREVTIMTIDDFVGNEQSGTGNGCTGYGSGIGTGYVPCYGYGAGFSELTGWGDGFGPGAGFRNCSGQGHGFSSGAGSDHCAGGNQVCP